MIEKRDVCKLSNPFLWECETFYLTYNKKENKIEPCIVDEYTIKKWDNN